MAVKGYLHVNASTAASAQGCTEVRAHEISTVQSTQHTRRMSRPRCAVNKSSGHKRCSHPVPSGLSTWGMSVSPRGAMCHPSVHPRRCLWAATSRVTCSTPRQSPTRRETYVWHWVPHHASPHPSCARQKLCTLRTSSHLLAACLIWLLGYPLDVCVVCVSLSCRPC